MITAPEDMRPWFLDQVRQTIEAHEAGEEARIVLKLNSLVDTRSIRALYEASQAGVPVDVNVRRSAASAPACRECPRTCA